MATIVEYDDAKVPVNAYPKRIVSPQAPKACCVTQMEQVGAIEQDGGRRFFYKQCKICGFTVRHFLPVDQRESVPDPQRDRRPYPTLPAIRLGIRLTDRKAKGKAI